MRRIADIVMFYTGSEYDHSFVYDDDSWDTEDLQKLHSALKDILLDRLCATCFDRKRADPSYNHAEELRKLGWH
jgi:hypothetical protein